MAIVGQPIDPLRAQRLRGYVDVYAVGNTWRARKWPRKTTIPATAAQLAHRNKVAAMIAARKALSQSYVDLFKHNSFPPGYSYDDCLRSSIYLAPSINRTPETIPPIWRAPAITVVTTLFGYRNLPAVLIMPRADAIQMQADLLAGCYLIRAVYVYYNPSLYPIMSIRQSRLHYYISHYACYKGKRDKPIYGVRYDWYTGFGGVLIELDNGAGYLPSYEAYVVGWGDIRACSVASLQVFDPSPRAGNLFALHLPPWGGNDRIFIPRPLLPSPSIAAGYLAETPVVAGFFSGWNLFEPV